MTLYSRTDYEWQDDELGTISVHTDRRARRLIFRTLPGGIRVTVPPGLLPRVVRNALEQMRPRLVQRSARLHPVLITEGWTVDNGWMKITVARGESTRFALKRQGADVTLLCPPGTQFEDPQVQTFLKKAVTEVMRRRAAEALPLRMKELSLRTGLAYRTLRIAAMHTRWGSCSADGRISLTCFLMKVPPHLADYVMLHELCHTRHMNHGTQFWQLLDRLTGGQARTLRRELAAYRADVTD